MRLDPGSCPAQRRLGQKAWFLPETRSAGEAVLRCRHRLALPAAGHVRVPEWIQALTKILLPCFSNSNIGDR